MSRTKKILVACLVVAGLLLMLAVSVHRAGRSGRITPAVVPIVADPMSEAKAAIDAGRYPEALAYYMQVPKGDRQYSRAQRFIGWELYGRELDQPLAGLPHVHRSLLAEPFSANSWQDASRTYGKVITGMFTKKP